MKCFTFQNKHKHLNYDYLNQTIKLIKFFLMLHKFSQTVKQNNFKCLS